MESDIPGAILEEPLEKAKVHALNWCLSHELNIQRDCFSTKMHYLCYRAICFRALTLDSLKPSSPNNHHSVEQSLKFHINRTVYRSV